MQAVLWACDETRLLFSYQNVQHAHAFMIVFTCIQVFYTHLHTHIHTHSHTHTHSLHRVPAASLYNPSPLLSTPQAPHATAAAAPNHATTTGIHTSVQSGISVPPPLDIHSPGGHQPRSLTKALTGSPAAAPPRTSPHDQGDSLDAFCAGACVLVCKCV
jgi:hypothetical protein